MGGTVEVGKWRLDGLTSLQKKSGLEQGWSELIRSGRRGWTRSQEIAITDQGETVVEEESKTFQTFEPTCRRTALLYRLPDTGLVSLA